MSDEIKPLANGASNKIGTWQVLIFLEFNRLTVRSPANLPISNADSKSADVRAVLYQ